MCTVISGETIDRGVEELGDSLTRSLGAESWAIRVVVHEGDLLGGLVRRVEVPLDIPINGFESIEIRCKLYLVEDEVETFDELVVSSL